MNKILTIDQAFDITKKLKNQRKKIVLTGGCFDILHPGHLALLQNAKEKGDVLFVLLENDDKIKILKGSNKPLFPQNERANMLAAFSSVDFVVLSPFLRTNDEYDIVVFKLSPDFIATTKQDPRIADKKRQAEKIGAQVIEVTDYLPQYATSKIIDVLQQEI